MNNNLYPNIILIDLFKPINDLKLHLGYNWLPTIDIEAVLSGLFTVFIIPEHIEQETNKFVFWIINDFIENRDLSDIQKMFIRDLLLNIIDQIHNELRNKGLLNNYFPYGFKQILPTGCVVLSKIDSG